MRHAQRMDPLLLLTEGSESWRAEKEFDLSRAGCSGFQQECVW